MKVDVRLYSPILKTRDDAFSRAARIVGEAAVFSNRLLIREAKQAGKPIPALYRSGVRYKNEEPGKPDQLVDIPAIIARGHGDCYHLSCWRVAELREQGKAAKLRITRKRLPDGRRVFHVLVRRGAKLEDPSRKLGM